MRVDLALDIFQPPVNTMQLDAIASLAFEGWHRLIVDDDRDASFLAWLRGLDIEHQEKWDQILSTGYALESREPATHVIEVTGAVGATSTWGQRPRLTIADAWVYLRSPFVALVEDGESDRSFVLAIASSEQRKALQEFENAGALRFENGGGVTNMPKRVGAITSRPGGARRMWALSDSDGMQPGQCTNHVTSLREACLVSSVEHHQLMRRNIENYITIDALRGWAYSDQKRLPERSKLFDAFRALSVHQRSHFNMKAGFDGDSSRTDLSAGVLYDGISDPDRRTLRSGFGKSISGLFASGEVKEIHLRRDDAWPELSAMITRLMELLR